MVVWLTKLMKVLLIQCNQNMEACFSHLPISKTLLTGEKVFRIYSSMNISVIDFFFGFTSEQFARKVLI